LSKLAARNSKGRLTAKEQLELQKFIALETTMRALKAKALVAKSGHVSSLSGRPGGALFFREGQAEIESAFGGRVVS
jgi:hypothetical protein